MLYYNDEPKNAEDESKMKKQDMKAIEIAITPLEIVEINKEEGNVFQKRETVVEVVNVKGVNRNFMFELKLNEG